ncbi:Ark- serine/threonine protein kinase [Teratosphaeriaceae sp. CCFEE 6253]|nr:Ark- serine/threonine protein kinase [Teratosphaeriaceae sp. CCFEE 6253]
MAASASLPSRTMPHRTVPAAAAPSSQPAGTFLPNTKVQVGSQRVIIDKYLSEGGFAHVYVVRLPRDQHKHELAVLKRVAVPDRDDLASMRTEVETMKKLKGHRKVVSYMDSHASQLQGGGYEVFLLMEYCSGGGLIDFMNTRLQHRLTEPEILKIFGDVAEGVACMHYLKPPLLHRDLKVENVLITKDAKTGTPIYKLCDFGSAAVPRPAAKTAEEGRLIEEDVQKHTTMQYRSPEMLDVWRKQPIDEKADIWALGVFLYKLCYYTNPFESVGQMAILHATFSYPAYPSFSDRLKKFIGWMLKEDPTRRPNIYEAIKECCGMRGVEVPIKDIYAGRSQSEARRNEALPATSPPAAPLSAGLQKAVPKVQVQSIPDIAPMRRGRPTAPGQQAPVVGAKPAASPARGDPFAALDSTDQAVRVGAVHELSRRFPSLDEFSIVHEKSGGFPSATGAPKSAAEKEVAGPKKAEKLEERVANALADEVFAGVLPKADVPTKSAIVARPAQPDVSPTKKPRTVTAPAREMTPRGPLVQQPLPKRPGGAPAPYRSTGVGSSPPPSAAVKPSGSAGPIWRVPTDHHHRAASQPRASESSQATASSLRPAGQRPAFLDLHRSKSQVNTLTPAVAVGSPPTASSRPSLEGHLPSFDMGETSISRARSANSSWQRPASNVYVDDNLEYLREQEAAAAASRGSKRPSMEGRRHSRRQSQHGVVEKGGEEPIEDDLGFLRREESEHKSHHLRKSSSHSHQKRTSLPSMAAGAKNIFAGRFGEAFKRFEPSGSGSGGDDRDSSNAAPVAPIAPEHDEGDGSRVLLSPIQGSEATATPGKHSHSLSLSRDDEDVGEEVAVVEQETEDLPPDVRRELERRRVSQEERRVADAAAEYRARVTEAGSGGAGSRASTIQKRVQTLLEEGRQSPVRGGRAEGYGRYTDATNSDSEREGASVREKALPVARKPVEKASRNPYPVQTRTPQMLPQTTPEHAPPLAGVLHPSISAPPTQYPAQPSAPQQQQMNLQRVVSRPSVPPKAQALRTGGSSRAPQWPPLAQQQQQQQSMPPAADLPPKTLPAKPTATGRGLAALLAKDLEGVPEYPPPRTSSRVPVSAVPIPSQGTKSRGPGTDDAGEGWDLEADFSKRYPSLAGIEMVETEIGGKRRSVREV